MLALNEIHLGDCLDLMREIPAGSVDSIVTSPPYAMQRAKQYGGIPEKEYPAWTVAWMAEAKRILKSSGSVLINIREHIKAGEISDYVLRTRLAVREAGWKECEELLWIKPDGPPVGSIKRPRRGYERILWFSPTGNPYCDAKANGAPTDRIGGLIGQDTKAWLHSGNTDTMSGGIARCADWVSVTVQSNERTGHPAAYPVSLAEWMLRLVTPPGGVCLDLFAGSGTTAVAALNTGRQFIGIERDPEYHRLATERVANLQPVLFTL